MKPLKAHPAANVFPLLNQSELQALAADIKANGLHNAIVVAGNLILDGRNRQRACKIAGVKPTFVQWKHNGNDPVDWIISQNLHRRHLSEDQRAIVAAKLRERLKRDLLVERNTQAAMARWRCQTPHGGASHRLDKRDSRVIAGRLLNVSRKKVVQAIALLQHADLAEKVATGQTTLALARRIVFQRERESVIVQANKRPKSECRLEHCDFRKLLPTLQGVDLIVVDPPYSRSELPLFEPLANLASKALAPQGTLAVMTGQSYLPEYIGSLSTHLEYRWTLSYAMPQGSAPNVWPRKANPFWKPVLIYQLKGAKPKQWIKKDIVTAGALDKDLHPWQQDADGFKQLIEMLSDPGDLVVDCFLGSGTTALAAMQATGGRKFIGCDVDLEAVRGARGRLGRRG